jgi:hypothetical protein
MSKKEVIIKLQKPIAIRIQELVAKIRRDYLGIVLNRITDY